MIRKSKLKNLLKEIWFGSSYCQSAQGILNIGNGHLIGKDHIELANVCQQCLYPRDIRRREVCQSIKWKVFGEILSKHMGGRLV
jgi:hypothetical protein